jgi:Fe-S-cluster containining protein
MAADPDHPSTWREWKKGLCDNCQAFCCRMPVEVTPSDLIRMGLCVEFDMELGSKHILKTYRSQIKSFSKSSGKYTLEQRINRDCLYLDANRRCTIYERRPDTCRLHPAAGPRPGFCAYEKKP